MANNNLQSASVVAMVRPAAFGFNNETAANNFFQSNTGQNNTALQQKALAEFDTMVNLLRVNGIDVLVLNDDEEPAKPDAIFPNNWFCCMDNCITVFPMCAVNRRTEKRSELLNEIKNKTGIFLINDLSFSEDRQTFLEGTGSMVIDHRSRIIYACLSVRTDEQLLKRFAAENNYTTVSFEAADDRGREIYHTNVVMCIGDAFSVICTNAVRENYRENIIKSVEKTGREIINISFAQMNAFAGNMLQLTSDKNEKLLIMSSTAFKFLGSEQIKILEKYSRLLVADISSIELAGGGSVRCMLAELFF